MTRFNGRVALVTGGASGMGKATAQRIAAEGGSGVSPAYHAAKGAVRLLTRTTALGWAQEGVRVNSVHPGYIWTPMVQNYLAAQPDPKAAKEFVVGLHPLGHLGEPNDIAYGVLYLASDESKFVTGAELVIDGGYTAQ